MTGKIRSDVEVLLRRAISKAPYTNVEQEETVIKVTTDEIVALLARADGFKIGSVKSERKSAAARDNGKKGGRPRKNLVAEQTTKSEDVVAQKTIDV